MLWESLSLVTNNVDFPPIKKILNHLEMTFVKKDVFIS